MEIKLNAGDKITIPTGCKATIKDNLIVIEEKQEEFKDGDILHSRLTDNVVIFKSYINGSKNSFCSHYNKRDGYSDSWVTDCFYLATEEEKQHFFDELKAKGLRWNASAKRLEKIRERAKEGEHYLYINRIGNLMEVEDNRCPFDNENYNLGNYYLLEAQEQAEEDAKAVKAIYEKRLKV